MYYVNLKMFLFRRGFGDSGKDMRGKVENVLKLATTLPIRVISNLMTTTEYSQRLNTAYSLLKQTVESDIRSAHDGPGCQRPKLPVYLDGMYSRLVQAVELERDVETALITADDMA